ncbi:MAG: caspase family protein, partial [Bacteroidota bacterium]
MQNETTSAKESNEQIFVLAVAINEYESEKVSNLKGCVKDVEDLEKMLKEQYAIPAENYLILKNEQATRANIIDSFRSHFAKLQAGDTAVFHYSGHGSWEDGSKEFVEAGLEEAGNRNELLVVQNYGQEGVFNIADKELRWLIHELQFAEDQTPKNINFIGLMDCCFSGSLFRDTEKRSRITLPADNQERGLKDYLEGQYQQLHETTGLKFPAVNFITFSACSPKESALEDNKGGLFTQALVTVLSQSKQELPSYAELHSRLKYRIEEGSGEAQHPFLEYEGKVNPYQSFLSQEVKAAQLLPPLIKKEEKWFTSVGAIHGIYESSWRKTEIQLYAANDLTTAIGTAKLDTIGIEECTLKPTFFNSAQASEEVVVGIYGDQLELSLRVETDMQAVADELVQKWEKSALNRQIRVLDQAKYQLKFDDSSISIYKEDQLLVGGKWDALAEEATADKETVMDFINHSVQQIIRWERIFHIQTPKRSKLDVEGIDI